MIAVSECAEHAKNTQTPTMAIVIPASGVQRPRSRSTPAVAAIRQGRLGANLAFSMEMRGPAIEQNRARQHALKQKTSARPAFGEGGKQTLQTRPPIAGLMLVILETDRKGQK